MMTMKFSLAMAAILSRCNTLMPPTSPYLFVSHRFPSPHRRPFSPRGLFQSPELVEQNNVVDELDNYGWKQKLGMPFDLEQDNAILFPFFGVEWYSWM
ncbi:hypothetical protein CsSME_00053791 [Camellia sinensis var. sinensis]